MDSVSTTPDDRRRCQVLGVPVDACRDVCAAALGLHARGGGRIVTLNAEMTMSALADAALGQAIGTADLVIPDGAGVVWAQTTPAPSGITKSAVPIACPRAASASADIVISALRVTMRPPPRACRPKAAAQTSRQASTGTPRT